MGLTKVSYAMINGAPVNALDYGLLTSGTGSANSTALQAAIDAAATAGKSLYIPAGTYSFASVVSTTGNLHIFGDGDSTVLDFSGITSASASAITVTGSVTQIQNITSATDAGLTIAFASAPSLVTGDVFCLFDNTRVWNAARSYYYYGEWCKCRDVSGLNATVINPLYDTYVAGTTAVYKLNSPEVSIRNIKIVGGANLYGLLTLTFCNQPIVENVTMYNENYLCFYLDRCYDAIVTNCNVYNKGGSGLSGEYGLLIGNSQNAEVTGGDYYGERHGISFGGGAGTCAVTCRNVIIDGVTTTNDISTGLASADYHGNTEDCYFKNCTMYQGVIIGGKNNGIDNCMITNQSGGLCILFTELKGGFFTIRNCNIITYADPHASRSRGIIDMGGNGGALLSSTTEKVSLVVENCYLYAKNQGPLTKFVYVGTNGSTIPVNIYIDGVDADADDMLSVLYARQISGTASSEAIVVNNVSNFPTGTYLMYPAGDGAAFLTAPSRMQKQTGRVDLTATSGTPATIGTSINFKYPYARVPATFATLGGTTAKTSIGGKTAVPSVYQTTGTYIRPQFATGDLSNFTSTETVSLSWMAAIDEV